MNLDHTRSSTIIGLICIFHCLSLLGTIKCFSHLWFCLLNSISFLLCSLLFSLFSLLSSFFSCFLSFICLRLFLYLLFSYLIGIFDHLGQWAKALIFIFIFFLLRSYFINLISICQCFWLWYYYTHSNILHYLLNIFNISISCWGKKHCLTSSFQQVFRLGLLQLFFNLLFIEIFLF